MLTTTKTSALAATVGLLALTTGTQAATVDIAEAARINVGEAFVPSSAISISENSFGGIGGNDPEIGPSNFVTNSNMGADTNFTFYGFFAVCVGGVVSGQLTTAPDVVV